MAESYPISTPDLSIASIRLSAINAVAVASSPFTFSQQVYRHKGQMWTADVMLPPMKRETAEEWVSFLLRLRGQAGTFLLGDPIGQTARGSCATTPGTPVTAGLTDDSLSLSGLPASQSAYFKAGDYIQIGTSLYKVLEDMPTTSGGLGTANLFPRPRTTPANGTAVIVAGAKSVFRLATNEVSWDINNASTYGLSFSAVEAL